MSKLLDFVLASTSNDVPHPVQPVFMPAEDGLAVNPNPADIVKRPIGTVAPSNLEEKDVEKLRKRARRAIQNKPLLTEDEEEALKDTEDEDEKARIKAGVPKVTDNPIDKINQKVKDEEERDMERTGILRQGSFKPHKLQSSAVETASVMQSIADSLLESGQPEAAASVALSALDMSLDEPLSVGTEAHFQAVSIIRKGIELAASADSLEDLAEEAELASLAHADAALAKTASVFSLLRKQA